MCGEDIDFEKATPTEIIDSFFKNPWSNWSNFNGELIMKDNEVQWTLIFVNNKLESMNCGCVKPE